MTNWLVAAKKYFGCAPLALGPKRGGLSQLQEVRRLLTEVL